MKLGFPFSLALITYLLTLVFKNNPDLTEKWYSTGIYPQIAYPLSSFSALFPFSLDDTFYVLLTTFFVIGLILVSVKQIRLTSFTIRLLQTIALLYSAFYFLWGFNYFRQPAHLRMQIEKSEPNTENFAEVFKLVAEYTNKAYTSWQDQDTLNFQPILEPSINELQTFLPVEYPGGMRRIKNISFSNFFAKATILGYYGPFFNEAHINKHLSVWDKPVVTAHEMCHQLGITSEAEANFYAWLITTNSENKFANYCGWLYSLGFFIYQSKDIFSKEDLMSMIKPEVINDYRSRHKHWHKLRNKTIDKTASKVNDVYLKSNNVKKGIDDYNGMVQLIIDFYLSEHKEIIF